MKRVIAALLAVCAMPLLAVESPNPFVRKEDKSRYVEPEQKPQQELEVALPAFPDKTSSWLRFETTAVTKNRFFIDRDSLSIGEDGVIRYALIIQSPSGVKNVSFEGMRCNSAEIKQYAWGGPDGQWSPARNPQWQVIRADRMNGQHVTLMEQYFCTTDAVIRKASDIVRLLEKGGVSRTPGDSTSRNPLRGF